MSLLNGESTPVSVVAGDAVVGGTTNLSSRLLVSVTAVGEASRVGRLMEVVRNATTHRTPWVMAADRVSKWFVLVVLLLALGSWGVWATIAGPALATQHTMALLTISCPCALALAAPLVLTVALGRAARKQIWIRDGNCLERLASPGIIWLDKTGTLTYGRMIVSNWHGDDLWLAYAAALEESLSTPIATAIREFAIAKLDDSGNIELPEATGIVYINGQGVVGFVGNSEVFLGNEALLTANSVVLTPEWLRLQSEYLENGRTVVWLAVQGTVVGMFGIGDSLRNDAIETLRAISDRGWRLGILSGDRQEIVDRVDVELRNAGIELVAALGNQTPERKLEVVRSSRQAHRGTCVMVGDGVNDAAAMASADVGIAIRGGSDQALRSAPIFLANQQLSSVVELIDASKNVVRGIRRCFAASLIYNSIAISLAMTGWIHPLVAAILMPLSGLTVLAMAIATRSFREQKQLGIGSIA
jgi:Cu2+-exporting ATPase